jgi:hypothetical protein
MRSRRSRAAISECPIRTLCERRVQARRTDRPFVLLQSNGVFTGGGGAIGSGCGSRGGGLGKSNISILINQISNKQCGPTRPMTWNSGPALGSASYRCESHTLAACTAFHAPGRLPTRLQWLPVSQRAGVGALKLFHHTACVRRWPIE